MFTALKGSVLFSFIETMYMFILLKWKCISNYVCLDTVKCFSLLLL